MTSRPPDSPPIDTAPSARARAWFYDGESAVRREVEIERIGEQFSLYGREQRHGPYAFADLEYVGERAGGAVYGLPGKDGWRMGLAGNPPADIAARLPLAEKYGRFIDRLGLGPATIAFAAISAAVLAVALTVPQWLAPIIPASVEQNLGDAMVGDLGGRICRGAAGEKALAALTARLDPDPAGLEVSVAKIPMVNAVALPGGKVIIFDGLLTAAKSPDELAGVLAHEIGHVRRRHVMQSLLRQLGLSVLMGGFDGNVGGTLNGLLSLSYTREAEGEADRFSLRAMDRADISPAGTAGFFARLAREAGESKEPDLTDYFSSHPHTEARRKLFADSVVKHRAYRPAMTQREWDDLRTMCLHDKKAKEGTGLGPI